MIERRRKMSIWDAIKRKAVADERMADALVVIAEASKPAPESNIERGLATLIALQVETVQLLKKITGDRDES